MKVLRITTASILVICAILSILFGAELVSVTSQVSSFSGNTDILGKVVDSEERPLENVSARSRDISTITDENGNFELKGVPQGKIEIELYKDGYIGLKMGLIAYPDQKRWIGDEAHPNDLRDTSVMLYDEIEWKVVGDLKEGSISNSPDESGFSTLDIMLDGDDIEGPVRIGVWKDSISIGELELDGITGRGDISFKLVPGSYNLTITGPWIIDRGVENMDLPSGRTNINLSLEEQSFLEFGVRQEVKGNYVLAGFYVVIGSVCLLGAYLAMKSDRWILLIIVSTASFFGRGPFDVMDINLMPLFSIIALVCTIMLRGEMVRRRRDFRPQPSGTT